MATPQFETVKLDRLDQVLGLPHELVYAEAVGTRLLRVVLLVDGHLCNALLHDPDGTLGFAVLSDRDATIRAAEATSCV